MKTIIEKINAWFLALFLIVGVVFILLFTEKSELIAIILAFSLFLFFFAWLIYQTKTERIRFLKVFISLCILISGLLFAASRFKNEKNILPYEERNKVTGNAFLSSAPAFGYFFGDIYNGSKWSITDMVIQIVVKEKDGSIRWSRKFKDSTYIPSLSTGQVSISVAGYENAGNFEWNIEEIRGYPPN
jgi:hypothetical protein